MTDKIKTGNKGEDIAANFLIDNGYEIVKRNYRYRHSEIDLIVKKNGFLIFVEVKTRSSTDFGEPEEFVTDGQVAKIFEGADEYIYDSDWHGPIRFDIVSVLFGESVTITHFEDAFH